MPCSKVWGSWRFCILYLLLAFGFRLSACSRILISPKLHSSYR